MTDFKTIANSDVPNGVPAEINTQQKVAFFIPIMDLENMLDPFNWCTRNFNYQVFKDGYANLCVVASLELQISYPNQEGDLTIRTFVGACNFALNSIEPNTHFLATAKSECIKNAASDIGKYFGRGLNNDVVPAQHAIEKKSVKSKPDSKIMQQFLKAVEQNDEPTITMLTNIYNIKNQENGK